MLKDILLLITYLPVRYLVHVLEQIAKYCAGRKLTENIEGIAKEKGCSSAEICLSWVMAKGGILRDGAFNFAAKDITLSKEDIEKLVSLGSQVKGLKGSGKDPSQKSKK